MRFFYNKKIETYLEKPNGDWLIFGLTIFEFKAMPYIRIEAEQQTALKVYYYNVFGEKIFEENLVIDPEMGYGYPYIPEGATALEILHNKELFPTYIPVTLYIIAET